MRGQLSPFVRLQIKITKLVKSNGKLREKVKELTSVLKDKDRAIAALEEKLQDKEAQRKELLSYMYKPAKKEGEGKPRGKKPGAQGFHRPVPPASAVSEAHTWTVTRCPACRGPVGKAVETVTKFEEDITLVPRNVVKKHVIARHWCPKCETYVRSADIPPISRIVPKTDRVIISDGYAAYKNLAGVKQQCWVHLLRRAKIRSPVIYHDLALLYHKLLIELEKPIEERNQRYFAGELDAIAAEHYRDPLALKVQSRLERHKRDLLTCLAYENVLPENNTAERAIRPQVVMRKISGGSRSPAGARAHAVNSSVLATLHKQNPNANFFNVLLPLIEKRRSEL